MFGNFSFFLFLLREPLEFRRGKVQKNAFASKQAYRNYAPSELRTSAHSAQQTATTTEYADGGLRLSRIMMVAAGGRSSARARECAREREKERGREREIVCVRACMRERAREREIRDLE